MKLDFAIYYELIEREYNAYNLLKCELERRGYKVRIANNFWVDYWKTFFWKPEVVIVSALRNDDELDFFTPFRKKKGKVVNMQFEQVIGDDENFLAYSAPKGRTLNAYHVCWGEKPYKRMLSWGVKKENIINVGAIQFDFLKGRLKQIYSSREKIAKDFHIDAEKKWLLFTSNFCYYSYPLSEVKKMLSIDATALKQYEEQERNLKLLAEWWERLLNEQDDIIIIYRPHPSERNGIAEIEELNNKLCNFYYIRDLPVQQWCIVADVVMTWNSTSALEAYFADKPIYAVGSLEGMNKLHADAEIINKDACIQDYSLFKEVIIENLHKTDMCALDLQKVQEYFGFTKKEYAYKELCDELEQIYKNGQSIHWIHEDLEMQKKKIKYFKQTFINGILLRIPLSMFKVIIKISSQKGESILKWRKNLNPFNNKLLKKRAAMINKIFIKKESYY